MTVAEIGLSRNGVAMGHGHGHGHRRPSPQVVAIGMATHGQLLFFWPVFLAVVGFDTGGGVVTSSRGDPPCFFSFLLYLCSSF